MKPILDVLCEVVYYDQQGCHVYWPADFRSDVLAGKLREARSKGLKACLQEVPPNFGFSLQTTRKHAVAARSSRASTGPDSQSED